MGPEEQQNVVTFENTGRLFISTLAYPLDNAKTLIQVGLSLSLALFCLVLS